MQRAAFNLATAETNTAAVAAAQQQQQQQQQSQQQQQQALSLLPHLGLLPPMPMGAPGQAINTGGMDPQILAQLLLLSAQSGGN